MRWLLKNKISVAFLSLIALAACGEPDSATVPALSDASCSVTTIGAPTIDPSAGYNYNLLTTSTSGSQAKVTISGGIPPFQISAQGFVGLSKTKTTTTFTDATGDAVIDLYLATDDAISSTVDPSCTTYVFYLQPLGPFSLAGDYSEDVTIRDSNGSTTTVSIAVTSSEPAA